MTKREEDVWNKMAVPTLDTLLEALHEVRRREKIDECRAVSLKQTHCGKSHSTFPLVLRG